MNETEIKLLALEKKVMLADYLLTEQKTQIKDLHVKINLLNQNIIDMNNNILKVMK